VRRPDAAERLSCFVHLPYFHPQRPGCTGPRAASYASIASMTARTDGDGEERDPGAVSEHRPIVLPQTRVTIQRYGSDSREQHGRDTASLLAEPAT